MKLFATLLLSAAAQAVVLEVPQDFATIGAAFQASAAHDVVLVAPGVYPGNLVFPAHAVELRSVAGPASTVLSATTGSVVTFQSGQTPSTVLEGFTIQGGTGTPVFLNGVSRGGVGGGVFCRNNSSPLIRHNWIENNRAAWPAGVGGGIFAWDSSPRIEQNWIRANTAHYGGGIYLQSSASLVLENLIEGNDTMPAQNGFSNGKGGGLRAMYGSPVIEGNTFKGNHCHWVGSAIALSEPGTTVSVTRNLLVGNAGNYPVDIAYSAHGYLACNLQWGNTPANQWPVSGYWTNQGGNGFADPQFCDGGEWPYRVEESSPCRPGQNPFGSGCGWIGATQLLCEQVVEADEELPAAWSLGLPWPNPFNPVTHVNVDVPELGQARLQLFNLRGELVRTLHEGLLEPGRRDFQLDAGTLPSGLYLLRLEAAGRAQVRKVSLIR